MSASEDPNPSYGNNRSGMNAPAEAATPASSLVAACDANAGDLATICAIVKAKTGHDFSSYKQSTLLRRIERRMALNDAAGLKEYLPLLESSQQEAQSLVQEILIGVTGFFRDPEAFATIRRDVIPRLFDNRDPDEPVRIWHPCCATGEEVYSTAMLIQEYLKEQRLNTRVQLFATDIDEAALSHARAGLFADESIAELGEERLRSFFTRCDGRWQVAKPLREMIVFAHHSLIKDPPFSKLDLLVCRNFLIYLNPDMQKRLISLFHLVLKPAGILFLGAAETVGRNAGLFVPIDKKWKIFERVAGPRGDDALFPFTAPVRRFFRMGQASRQDLAGEPSPDVLAERVLLERYSPPFVVVNEKYEVIHVSARAGRFLEVPVGGPSRDVLRMARGGLRPALRAAIYKAFSEQGKVSFPGVKIDAGEGGTVNVLVEPLAGGPSAEKLVMVVLEPAVMTPLLSPFAAAGVDVPDDETSKDMLIRQLEEQLRITHEQLRVTTEQLETSNEGFLSANEELMSINEEFQSANEELQSTNEELETSREELQALNEELVTVNGELQETVEELKQATGDMENLLASSEIATIFLDRQLAIKRFSPAMAALFNLIPADIGRPFRHPAGTLDWIEPDKDAALVLETLVPVEREVTAVRNGRSFLMRVLPYRTMDGVVDGIVVTLVDISELKRLEAQTVHLASFPQLNPNPVIEVDYSGTVIFANPATRTVVEQLRGEAEAVTAFLPADFAEIVHDWDKACEVILYREVAIEEKTFGATVFLSPQFDVVRIYAYDISERKLAEDRLRRARDEWERTFDSVPDLIAIIDSRHRIVRANRAMAERLGKSAEACIGQACYHRVHGTDEPVEFCPHVLSLADGREHATEVYEEQLGGHFMVTTTPLLDEQGRMTGTVHVARDITARKKAEQALRESEERVRRKLDSILAPEGDIGALDLADIIDARQMQSLMDNFYLMARIPMAMIDIKGNVLVGVGWQDVCTKYHRVHPETCKNCIESDTVLTAGVPEGEYRLYKCRNNMWDVATPIIIGGKHFGNIFMGQFFFEDEPLDYGLFRSQAKRYGFDEHAYIAAVERVPRLKREFLAIGMAHFMELAAMVSRKSYSNLKLARSLAERDSLLASLRESEASASARAAELSAVMDALPVGIVILDAAGGNIRSNATFEKIWGGPRPATRAIDDYVAYKAWRLDTGEQMKPGEWASARSIMNGETVIGQLVRIERFDGTPAFVHNSAAPIVGADGEIAGSVVAIMDITDLREAENALQKSAARLNLLAETASDLLGSNAPQTVVETLCAKVMAYLDCHVFFNFLVDEQMGRLRLNACAGISAAEAKKIEWLDYGLAVCGCVARDGCRIVVEDIQTIPDPRTELVKSYGIQAYACHPLLSHGRVLGTLSFGTRTRKQFSDSDLSLMKAVADQVAIALERKFAGESLRKAHDELDQRVRERTEDLATTVETLLGEITVRERAEKGLQRLNRLYAVLSETNQTIVRAADRDSLFSDFCRIAVENGGFLLSWVGLADEESGQVKVAAAWGASAYLDDIRISARNEPNGGGPTGIAIREGSSVICNDFQNDPCTRPWHERGTRYGIRSSASIAFKEEGRVIGALTLYAGEKDFFDRQHVALLQQMSADISFALDNFKREIRRREAEQALQNETLERLRTAESLREKEQLLMQQSRLAAMGEMINNIAHQWRQPLNVLGLNIQRLMLFYEMGDFSSAFLQTSTDDAMKLIKHMSQTIDDFRNFFKSDKEKTDFSVNQAIQLTISLVQDGLKSNHVEIVTHSDGDPLINGYYNEFCQVLLNILQNARDAIVERKIAAGKVSIASGVENGMTVITITDNAGGIPEEILGRVFEPYFSTKGVQGTGIGLFMSKNIIETNMGGRIAVRNTTHGAEFRIEV
jgi:PAS domain S-box-containing protein